MLQSLMRITFVLPQDNLAGGMRVLATYADRLSRRGHQVTVSVSPPDVYTLKQRIKDVVRGRGLRPPKKAGSHFDGLAVKYQLSAKSNHVTDADLPDADV